MEEDLAIQTLNKYYLENDVAVVYKKPTPVKVVKQINEKIVSAFFEKPSTTDYNGVYKGKYLDFEAKETKSKTSLVLSIFHPHQLQHLERVVRYGGIGFTIIRFKEYDETYFVKAEILLNKINSSDKKSIPYNWFKENGILIPYRYQKKVDYLKVIDEYILEEQQ